MDDNTVEFRIKEILDSPEGDTNKRLDRAVVVLAKELDRVEALIAVKHTRTKVVI